MARARNIKPAFFKNEVLAELSPETRLLFIGLWTLADREGRLEDRPRRIKIEIFPLDQFDVESMLCALQKSNFIVRYEVDGNKYIQIVNFVKHQDPHYREKKSEIPPPEGHDNQIVATNVTRTQRARILERDQYKCQACGSEDQLCVDHILPVSRGGDSGDENLQVLCLSCNTKKGNRISAFDDESKSSRTQSNAGADRALIPDSGLLNPDSLIPETLCDWAREKGLDHPSLQSHWEYFLDYLAANPKVAKRYSDINAAFRNCVRSDWGGIRKNWGGRIPGIGQDFGKTSQGIALLESMKG